MITSVSRLCKGAVRNLFKLVISIALIGMPCILINQYKPDIINSITQQISHHVIIFGLIRWSIILLIFLGWPYFVRAIAHHYGSSEDEIAYWQAKRFHMTVWLILFDVLVCQNIIGKLIHLI